MTHRTEPIRHTARLAGAVVYRPLSSGDLDPVLAASTGHIANKRPFIEASFERRSVLGAVIASDVAGYTIWDRSFFSRPFVWLLGVRDAYRRRGVATGLLAAVASAVAGEALFTSTNESNAAMRELLTRSGFLYSGRIEHLDPGDPELFFVLPAGAAVRAR